VLRRIGHTNGDVYTNSHHWKLPQQNAAKHTRPKAKRAREESADWLSPNKALLFFLLLSSPSNSILQAANSLLVFAPPFAVYLLGLIDLLSIGEDRKTHFPHRHRFFDPGVCWLVRPENAIDFSWPKGGGGIVMEHG
jgi:hypothetical protein